MSSATIIDCKALARRIRNDAANQLSKLRESGVGVRLDAILVGDPDSGRIYAAAQQKRCEKLGIEYRLHNLDANVTDRQLQQRVLTLSHDPQVNGIMLNLPLPDHLDTPAAQYSIDPYKDVEGVNPANIGLMFYGTPIIAPCTALAVMAILREANIDVKGRRVAIVGQGSIVGKPIALALMGEEATVTTCNRFTDDLIAGTRSADVLIAAAGVPELIGPEHVKPGAIVVDVGINTVPAGEGEPSASRVVGDVKFDEVCKVAGGITPVPGGVGPVTVAILLQSTVAAASKQRTARRIQSV